MPIGLLGPLQAAAHAQQVVEGDRVARIALTAPLRHRCPRVDVEAVVLDQRPHQRGGDALGHGEPVHRLVAAVLPVRAVALVDELAALDDDDRANARIAAVVERDVDRVVDRRAVRSGQPLATRP